MSTSILSALLLWAVVIFGEVVQELNENLQVRFWIRLFPKNLTQLISEHLYLISKWHLLGSQPLNENRNNANNADNCKGSIFSNVFTTTALSGENLHLYQIIVIVLYQIEVLITFQLLRIRSSSFLT